MTLKPIEIAEKLEVAVDEAVRDYESGHGDIPAIIETLAKSFDEAAQLIRELVERERQLAEIEGLARELISTGLRTIAYADTPKLVVVEKADKSDAHYRLCVALESRPLPSPPEEGEA